LTIAVLAGHPDSPYALRVLRAINASGVRGVHVVAATWKRGPRDLTGLVRKHGLRLQWVGAKWVTRAMVRPLTGIAPWRMRMTTLAAEVAAQGGRFVVVDDVNDESCRDILRRWNVDLLVLAGAPIMREPVLAVPRIGTLNAHQGALPRFRGMNVIEWAVFERSAPSVTVHFVDAGIDTGDVVASEVIDVRPGDTLEAVRARAVERQVDLLARTVRSACSGTLPRIRQLATDGRQYYVMHQRIRAITDRRLSEIRARRPVRVH